MTTRGDYGQVYRCVPWALSPTYGPYAWRGAIWTYNRKGAGRCAWEGKAETTPDEAYDAMCEAAQSLGVTDLRRWSGTLPERIDGQ